MTWKNVGIAAAAVVGTVLASNYWFAQSSSFTEFTFPAPDPDPQFVKPPKAWQSYGCKPLTGANTLDDRFKKQAVVLIDTTVSDVAINVNGDEKHLSLMRAKDVAAGITSPETFTITSKTKDYMLAEEEVLLGKALIIFDAKTMKMVWTFNGQGMLGIKGESVLFQCR